MQVRLPTLLMLVFYIVVAPAADMEVNGVYQGKDVYVQNPYSRELKSFCTEIVFVNDKPVISNPTTSAYRIDLSFLSIGDPVVIRIQYREGYAPKIINPEVIQPSGGFAFLMARVGKNAITWMTKGEYPGGKYIIQRNDNERWINIKEIPGFGQIGSNNYAFPVNHIGGENIYRLHYIGSDGKGSFSNTLSYTYEVPPITFTPTEATSKLYLSEETEFLITDASGRKYKKGKGRIINVHTLKPGEYFLHIQGRSEPFKKL